MTESEIAALEAIAADMKRTREELHEMLLFVEEMFDAPNGRPTPMTEHRQYSMERGE